ncbi:MAG: hypothetical protein ACXVWU_01250 [Nocardioides sp.]
MRPLGALLCLPLLLALACCGSRTPGSGARPSTASCAGTSLGPLSVDGTPETVRLRVGRLCAGGDGGLRLLRTGDGSVLPAVAADGGGAPATATCTVGGFAVWTATAHQPPGVVLAWDVRRTSYTLHGTRLTTGPTRLVEQGTADPTLRTKMPQVFDPRATFSDC